MAPSAESQSSLFNAENPIPDGEKLLSVSIHAKGAVQAAHHGRRIVEIGSRENLVGESIEHADGQETRSDAMPADVQHVDSQMLLVEPMEAKSVAAQLRRWNKPPIDPDVRTRHWRRQQRLHIVGRLRDLVGQLTFAFRQIAECLAA